MVKKEYIRRESNTKQLLEIRHRAIVVVAVVVVVVVVVVNRSGWSSSVATEQQ